MKIRYLLIIALPFAIGLALRLLLANSGQGNPILYLRADLGTLALVLGLLGSILAGILTFVWLRLQRSQQEALAEARLQAQADRRLFLQRLDHELKNPLTAIQAGLANLQAGGVETPGVLESVSTQTIRLSRLVADLRKISELGSRPIEKTRFSLDETLREAVGILSQEPQAGERRISLNLPQAPWPLPEIYGDPDLLFLAFHNLLINALKFTETGDTIEVRAAEDGAMVLVEVADTGPGIPEEEIPFLWQELYRGKGARGIPGSGLGLALVRAIVERHGGSTTLRSRLGSGTVVTLRLPLEEPATG